MSTRSYELKLEHNSVRCVEYSDLRIEKQQGSPSETTYRLVLWLRLATQPYLAVSTGPDTRTDKINEFYAIGPVSCELWLKTKDTGKTTRIDLESEETRWYTGGYIKLSRKFTAADAEILSSWRAGETVNVSWYFKGYTLVNGADGHVLLFQDTTQSSNNQPAIGPEDFVKKLVVPLGLSNKMIVEIPVETPRLLNSMPTLPAGIASLRPSLQLLITHLQSALEKIRNADKASDYRSVITEVRAPLDSVKSFSDQKRLGKELLADTGIIRDLDPGAAEEAAEEIMQDIWASFRSLHGIASKPLHTTTRSGKKFSISPERADAEFALLDALTKAQYLNARIETSLSRL